MGFSEVEWVPMGCTGLERLSNGFDGILSGLRWVRQGYNESNPLETGFSGLRWVLHRISMGFVVFFPFYLNFDLCENDDRCRGFRGLFLLFSLSGFIFVVRCRPPPANSLRISSFVWASGHFGSMEPFFLPSFPFFSLCVLFFFFDYFGGRLQSNPIT